MREGIKAAQTEIRNHHYHSDRKQFLTMEEGLCWDEEGSGAHPEQCDEFQEPEAAGQHKKRV